MDTADHLMDPIFFVFNLFGPFKLLISLVVIWFLYRLWRGYSQREIVRNLSQKHRQVLAKKRAQLLVEDDYGDLDPDKWIEEVQSFFSKKIEPYLHKKWEKHISSEEVGRIIERAAVDYQEHSPELFQYDDSMDGIEYEHYCADILRKSGWDAIVSKASGDQGVDIFASNQRLSVAIQCKKYSNPVGNKAVQEVTSGATFQNADHAVVVSNSSYTTSARQLAAKSGVLLLHHSELDQLDEKLYRQ